MHTAPDRPHDEGEPGTPLERVTIEPDFDYSWLSKEPPGYEDVGEDGQVINPAGGPTSGE